MHAHIKVTKYQYESPAPQFEILYFVLSKNVAGSGDSILLLITDTHKDEINATSCVY